MKQTLAALTLIAMGAGTANAAPTANVVFSFKRPLGENPTSPLLERGGEYFLSLFSGGHKGCDQYKLHFIPCGTVLRLTPPNAQSSTWRGKLIHEFLPATDGYFPRDMPVPYDHGKLIMTTSQGGPTAGGSLIELLPPASAGAAWTEQPIATFDPNTQESLPLSGPHTDSSGNIFLALSGQEFVHNCGSIIEFSPPAGGQGAWTETVIHEFQYTDGCWPADALRSDTQGNLYALTQGGGTKFSGAFIEFSPPAQGGTTWSEQVLYDFGINTADGVEPNSGLIADPNGNFYGLTAFGGATRNGAIYELSPPAQGGTQWTEQVLYSFTGGADGGMPYRGLVRDAAGNIFATTLLYGDPTCQCGTLVELSPPAAGQTTWTETTLYKFPGIYGNVGPQAITVEDNGNFLVPTYNGGQYNEGALIELTNTGYVVKK